MARQRQRQDSSKRNGKIITRKFFRYLIPMVMSTIAISLNEFVDSIIVSQVLGAEAMTLVNLGSPLMLAFAVMYSILGVGGSILYGKYAGEQNPLQAGKTFTMTLLVSFAVALLTTAIGLSAFRPLCNVLCRESSMQDQFMPYIRILLFSGLLIIPLQVIIYFLSSLGRPGLGMAVNLTANGVNLLADYIFMRYLDTGLKGAAMATFTGYLAGILIVVAALLLRKLSFPLRRFGLKDMRLLPAALSRGIAPATNQLGYCLKISFCNTLASMIAGLRGMMVFSLCMQAVSIASIIIAGIVEAMLPIASSLQGQRDFNGIRILLRTVFRVQFLANLAFVILMEVYPQFILVIYNIPDAYRQDALLGLRIFSLMFVFRGFVLVFMYYFQISNRKAYAFIISITDGFAGIIPMAMLMTHIFGITGLWIAFPLLSAVMIVIILGINTVVALRKGNKFHGILLLEREDERIPTYDATIKLDDKSISDSSRELQEFCSQYIRDDTLPVLIAVAAEEMSVYSMSMRSQTELDEMDILVKIYPQKVLMDFRSMGKPFNIATAHQQGFSNALMLKKIASSEEYSYLIGLNQTRIHIGRKRIKEIISET
ncbi:MAG: hypothetical protein ILP16_04710 [Spirochaetales bacterium]|nr:hypothetical protein [Spirochaetales bacterium]